MNGSCQLRSKTSLSQKKVLIPPGFSHSKILVDVSTQDITTGVGWGVGVGGGVGGGGGWGAGGGGGGVGAGGGGGGVGGCYNINWKSSILDCKVLIG